jgi:hypothetical protein
VEEVDEGVRPKRLAPAANNAWKDAALRQWCHRLLYTRTGAPAVPPDTLLHPVRFFISLAMRDERTDVALADGGLRARPACI